MELWEISNRAASELGRPRPGAVYSGDALVAAYGFTEGLLLGVKVVTVAVEVRTGTADVGVAGSAHARIPWR